MSSRTTTQRNEYRDHMFRNADMAGVGDASGLLGSAAPGSVHLSLCTAWPGLAATQATSEATLAGYSRKAVARTIAKWTQATNSVENTDDETFTQITAVGPEQVWYAGIGDDLAGAGKLRWIVPLGVRKGVFTAAASGNLLTLPGHGLVVDNRVALHTADATTLPTGATEGTIYYVGTAPDGDTLTLSTTAANANPVVLTVDGGGQLWKMDGLALSLNNEPKVKANQLKIFFG